MCGRGDGIRRFVCRFNPYFSSDIVDAIYIFAWDAKWWSHEATEQGTKTNSQQQQQHTADKSGTLTSAEPLCKQVRVHIAGICVLTKRIARYAKYNQYEVACNFFFSFLLFTIRKYGEMAVGMLGGRPLH